LVYKDADSDVSMSEQGSDDESGEYDSEEEIKEIPIGGSTKRRHIDEDNEFGMEGLDDSVSGSEGSEQDDGDAEEGEDDVSFDSQQEDGDLDRLAGSGDDGMQIDSDMDSEDLVR
jgi:hypothetical protein